MKTIELIQQSYNKKLEIEGILLTMVDKRNSLSSLVEKDVRNILEIKFTKQLYQEM